MPWSIKKREGQFCVVKDADGSTEKCHDTEEAARKHMAALYANEPQNRSQPVEIRTASVTGVDQRQRLIDMIAVPWEQEAEVFAHGEIWREVFQRGAFAGLEESAGRVRVNREHHVGDTVGKAIRFSDTDEGELAVVKIAETSRGDETLALAEEDMLSASVGYRLLKPSDVRINNRTRLRRVVRAFMDHLALVEQPAYAGAHVLAVREGPSELGMEERVPTPALDEVMNDPVLEWARSKVDRNQS